MNDKPPTFWPRATSFLAARLPPWQIAALVVGHVVLHVSINVFWQRVRTYDVSAKELVLAPLFLCQMALLFVWMSLGRAPGPVRVLVVVLVMVIIQMPPGPYGEESNIAARLFWPNGSSFTEPLFGEYGAWVVGVLMLYSATVVAQLVLLGVPLTVLRLAGLRLNWRGESLPPARARWQFSVRQLLMWTATVGIGLFLVRSIEFSWVLGVAEWPDSYFSWLSVACASLPAIAFSLATTLGARLSLLRLASAILVAFALTWGIWSIPDKLELPFGAFMYGPRGVGPGYYDELKSILGYAWLPPLIMTLVPFASLLVVRSAGYRLTWRASAPSIGDGTTPSTDAAV